MPLTLYLCIFIYFVDVIFFYIAYSAMAMCTQKNMFTVTLNGVFETKCAFQVYR